MARIIHNLSDKIISVTQSQLRTRGYMGTTIRSVAQECGIAVGTVYMVPTILMFLYGEDYLLEGITYSGGIKG